MSMECVNPEKQSNVVFDQIFENELQDSYQTFMNIVKSIPEISQTVVFDLENIFILSTRQAVELTLSIGNKATMVAS
ncbi:hypothetical protein A8708_33165 [Paenibacillus oryzisoli]|uniref:Uncharacterized protein n=1 Tax=Paenibacillus oryzisoli TaxID=1850517 RepID=A0A197ZWN7_9BACL|nr:hypothetical protein A8708_33165 [Paenibacillus oryzisoli]